MSKDNQDQVLLMILADLDQLKPEVRDRINFHGGWYNNHELFWESMKPNGGGEPSGALKDEIVKEFGSFEKFEELFSVNTAAIQGVLNCSGFIFSP
jgi:Fe-Mn family superoxide dismutase